MESLNLGYKRVVLSGGLSPMKCNVCFKKTATQMHHKFPKGTKNGWKRKLYGDLLEHPFNLIPTCADCNTSHANPDLPIWTEKEFCDALKIQPRSKTERGRQ